MYKIVKSLAITVIIMLTTSVTLATFSSIQQKAIYSITDRILEVTNKQPTRIKKAIWEIRKILTENYMKPAVVDIFEESVRNLIPYMQCPSIDCQPPKSNCHYNNPIMDDQGCIQSCGELNCECDEVSCATLPHYCSYPFQVRDEEGCLWECGKVQCVCPEFSCPDDGQEYIFLYDEYGCANGCRVSIGNQV